MITLLTGDNSFEIRRTLDKMTESFDGQAEKLDGSILELKRIPDLLMGATLFAQNRLVIIRNISENTSLWTNLTNWLPRVSDNTHLVLVEEKPDKRTKTYKELQKIAEVKEFKAWIERDTLKAEKWIGEEVGRQGFSLDKKSIQTLVSRVGIDQWLLYQALQKLAVLDKVTPEVIEQVIDANPSENIFLLFEAALKGDRRRIMQMLKTLRLSEDPYRLFGLLSNQTFYLLALSLAAKPSSEVAKDLGVHPFALSKLAPFTKTHRKGAVKNIVQVMIEADEAIKTSADPWLAVERALIKIAQP